MKITLKFANEIKTYPTIGEAKKFLNEADYYSERVELLHSFDDSETYTKNSDLKYMQQQANIYGEGWITVIQIFE